MYFVFTPNKVFVQFQLIDYFGDATDFYVVFTPDPHFSLKKFAKKQKKQKIEKKKRRKANSKLNSVKLDAHFTNKQVIQEEISGSNPKQTIVETPPLLSRFNLIQLDETNFNLAA